MTRTVALIALTALTALAQERIEVEAESFQKQEKTGKRQWHIVRDAEASGGAYIEIRPDTRRTHDDKLIRGENFSDTPGEMAIVQYRVKFPRPGRYFLWVRALSFGTEDNGVHAGINETWPDSGKRLQWCEGKGGWRWESKQRTERNHCGEEGLIWLDVPSAGVHTVSFSMREDGFRMDKFLLTNDPKLSRPD